MTHKILVTGATGTIGKALIKALLEKKTAFIAAVRDTETAREKLSADVELVSFNFKYANTFEAQLRALQKYFYLVLL